jgi:heme/copper-type cytochrome/quinol oxidase subunit 3
VTHDAAHAMHPPTSTGLDSRKLAIWTFIGSECLFFASLISTYVIYRGQDLARFGAAYTGPTPANTLEISLVTFGTALLLFSSFFVVLALNGLQHNRRGQFLTFLGLTILCGLFFVGMQVYEFTHFVHEGLTIHTNLFGASFFTLTGFHGTHVSVGVLWLITLFILGLRGKLTPEKALNLEIAALYWHFVDVVWIVIFPVVYLMK